MFKGHNLLLAFIFRQTLFMTGDADVFVSVSLVFKCVIVTGLAGTVNGRTGFGVPRARWRTFVGVVSPHHGTILESFLSVLVLFLLNPVVFTTRDGCFPIGPVRLVCVNVLQRKPVIAVQHKRFVGIEVVLEVLFYAVQGCSGCVVFRQDKSEQRNVLLS